MCFSAIGAQQSKNIEILKTIKKYKEFKKILKKYIEKKTNTNLKFQEKDDPH